MADTAAGRRFSCPHRKLIGDSGGYFLHCIDCGLEWACTEHHAENSPCRRPGEPPGGCQNVRADGPGTYTKDTE